MSQSLFGKLYPGDKIGDGVLFAGIKRVALAVDLPELSAPRFATKAVGMIRLTLKTTKTDDASSELNNLAPNSMLAEERL
ncbi:MAG: hypothetical protein AB8B47_01330 [Roseobacter sp.]